MNGAGKRSERKRNGKRTAAVCLILLAVLAVSAAVIFFLKSQGDRGGKNIGNDGQEIELPDYIEKDFLPINEYSRPGERTDEIVGIVIHYVGNPGTSAKANRNYFAGLAESGETYASSNFIVGLDGEVIECVPLGEIAYASNSRNRDTISIECCHPDEDGKYNDATYDSLVRLCRFLVEEYGITRENVIRHYDVTGKLCPLYYVEHEDAWQSLLDDIFE